MIDEVEAMGGMTRAVEAGMPKLRIEEAAARRQARVDRGEEVVVGVNRYVLDEEIAPQLQRVDERVRDEQVARTAAVRAARDENAVRAALAAVAAAASGTDNLLPPMREALRRRATLQEVCDVLRAEFGTHSAQESF